MEEVVAVASVDIVKREWADLDSAVKEHSLEELMANIGECNVGDSSKILVCIGLGSCVGVVIFDPEKKIAGLAHVMLPSKNMAVNNPESAYALRKFADVAIPYILESLIKLGCSKSSLRSKIAGGAQMFKNGGDEMFDIGKRNVVAVKEQLSMNGIPLIAEDIHGSEGRTMKFVVGTSKAYVRTKNRMIVL